MHEAPWHVLCLLPVKSKCQMSDPALSAIEHQYARTFPVSYSLSNAHVRKAVARWVRVVKEWMAAYPANAPELASWGLSAGQAAYCLIAWSWLERAREGRVSALRSALYELALADRDGQFDIRNNVPDRKVLCKSVTDALLAGYIPNDDGPIVLRPTCVIEQPIYKDRYLTEIGLNELLARRPVLIGETLWRVSSMSKEHWKSLGVPVSMNVVRPEDAEWALRWNTERYPIRGVWQGWARTGSAPIEIFDASASINAVADSVPTLRLVDFESRFCGIADRIAGYLKDCKERLEAESPIGPSPWEIRFGEVKQEHFGIIKWQEQRFAPEVLRFHGQQLILLRLPLHGGVKRLSYIIPRDVLYATVHGNTLHVECRGHRSIEWTLPDWKRAKELQDHIERHRTPMRQEHRRSDHSWR